MNIRSLAVFLLCVFAIAPKSFAGCPQVESFPDFSALSPKQQELISAYLPDASVEFSFWSVENNGLATEFLANTQALEHLRLRFADGSDVPAIDLITRIKRIEGDRMKVELNADLFERWRMSGAHFKILRSNGRIESGNFRFNQGDLGGSLHHGYDIQGYSSYFRMPRIQMNYRFRDHEADIDLDAYSPWIWGFIPDPRHLTWNNSDPRCWIHAFEKKYGKLFLE